MECNHRTGLICENCNFVKNEESKTDQKNDVLKYKLTESQIEKLKEFYIKKFGDLPSV